MNRAALLLALLAGCASVPRDAGFKDVNAMARERLGHDLRWDRGGEEDAQVRDRLRALLAAPLTDDGAVEVALLHNRGIQAVYEELGIAQADLVQAGLLRNPTFGATVRFPHKPSGSIENEFSIAQDFLDLFTLPLRKHVAAAQFEQAKLRVGNEVLQLAGQVRTAYFTLLAAQHMSSILRETSLGYDALSQLAELQREAGNINDLELSMEVDAALTARTNVARSDGEMLLARERLAGLLGVYGGDAAFKTVEMLPELPESDPALDKLESVAIRRRLDLGAARAERDVLASLLSTARGTRFIPGIQVGAATANDTEGNRVTGPTVSLELPIFDQGQARLSRLESQARQADARLEDLAVRVRSEVRSARSRLVQERATVEFYRGSVLPVRERIMKQSQLHYNAMQIGLVQLLNARQGQTNAYRDYVEALRGYWTARSDLELAVGGRMGAGNPPAAAAR